MKKSIPYIVAIVVFVGITLSYFSPLLKGKEIKQSDNTTYLGMSKEIRDFREKNNEEVLWTNSMFGGMPAYQISIKWGGAFISYLDDAFRLWLPHPAGLVFLYLLGFYFLLLTLKIDPWLSIVGAIAFAFSSYFFVIIEAGHNSKAHAIGYMAPILASVILTFRGKYILGSALTAMFLALEIFSNHLQITYYLFLILLVYFLVELYIAIKNKKITEIIKPVSFLLVSAVIAVCCNAGNLWATYEYGKSTTRGKSELTNDIENKTSGLDRDYATAWSYGVGETFTLLIPNFKGGASGYIANSNKDVLKKVDPQFQQAVASSDSYWGATSGKTFTSGPVYAGAVVMFLCILALFILEGTFKWFLFWTTLLSIFLAWGRNFMSFTNFFLDYFPGYNKFRTVEMILVIAELTIPLLAFLVLDKLIKSPSILKEKIKLPFIANLVEKQKMFYVAFALTGGLCLLMYLMPTTFNSFSKENEYSEIYSQIKKSNSTVSDGQVRNYLDSMMPAIEGARIEIFKADAIRSFIMILLAASIIWFYVRKPFDSKLLYVTLAVIILADMWSVNKRYLDEKSFVSKQEAKNPFKTSNATLEILKDTDPDYRVLNIAANTFNDASTSYFHKSIGGYHGAKLKRYQELIEHQISNNIRDIVHTLQVNPTDSAIRIAFSQQSVLNMLNTKYIIYNEEAPPLQNRYALGNAWLVNDVKWVKNADEEIASLSDFNPSKTAVVDERFKSDINNFSPKNDASATIQLKSYKPNHLTYDFNSSADELAVFSEIYYADGWNAYVDGALTPHFRANYVLRAMKIPAGKHTVEFKFEPKLYSTSASISTVAFVILLLFVGYAIYASTVQAKKE